MCAGEWRLMPLSSAREAFPLITAQPAGSDGWHTDPNHVSARWPNGRTPCDWFLFLNSVSWMHVKAVSVLHCRTGSVEVSEEGPDGVQWRRIERKRRWLPASLPVLSTGVPRWEACFPSAVVLKMFIWNVYVQFGCYFLLCACPLFWLLPLLIYVKGITPLAPASVSCLRLSESAAFWTHR